MPRGKKKAFRPRIVQVTMEIETGNQEAHDSWMDHEAVATALEDLLSDCALIETVCKDLGYADSEPVALSIKDLREDYDG